MGYKTESKEITFMSETNFKKICKVSDLPNRRGKKFTIVCPHNQSNVMNEGYLDESLFVACPIHGWQFSLETGKVPPECKGLSATLETYEVKIENDEVWIEVKEKKKKWFF